MGNSPSKFKGEDRPVETVSWEDAHAFIDTMNNKKPALTLCLPSEAQWEYACRAGTTTPFHFGENITSEEVNFRGTKPYNDGRKSDNRNEIIAVASLPCNAWGLYEMYGNVWEWCRDSWLEHFGSQSVTDPENVISGAYRVLRGGSWIGDGKNVRSACRRPLEPTRRFDDVSFGFRLARGHELKQERGASSKPER